LTKQAALLGISCRALYKVVRVSSDEKFRIGSSTASPASARFHPCVTAIF
jgi:hypothetical protein